MANTDLLTIGESAQRAHVSEDTIREYAKLGFLRATSRDGETYFSAAEINSIFSGFSTAAASEATAYHGAERKPSDEKRTDGAPHAAPADGAAQLNGHDAAPKAQPFSLREQIDVSNGTESPPDEENFVGRFRKMRGDTAARSATVEDADFRDSFGPRERPITDDYELTMLNRRLREEIQMLRDERDWLRQRLEKLEARSERDQMLLLSESENVRGLVNLHQGKKSFWLRALPWLKTDEK